MNWFLSRLAVLELSRRKGQAVLIVLGLMVSTAVITGSLVVGDSMEYLVYRSTFENLGDVDIVVRGGDFFDYNYYSTIENNATVQQVIDKAAPMILLPCSVTSSETELRENKAQLFGITGQARTFGAFTNSKTGNKLDPTDLNLGENECMLNEVLAALLNIKENEQIKLAINNPTYAIDTVYSQHQGFNAIEHTMTVKYIAAQEGLGQLQLDGRSHSTPNIFMNLTALQDLLDIGNKINLILISNLGDKYTGIDNDEKVTAILGKCLDSKVGYEELGYEFDRTDLNYVRLINHEIFFDHYVYDLVDDHNSLQNEPIDPSPVLTYFVNSITLDGSDRTINYSIITGLDLAKDAAFGDFEIQGSGNDLDLANNEIALLDWTADQLGAAVNDTVTMEYMALDRFYNVYNTTHQFKVKYIIGLSGIANDAALMPAFPGLSGKLDCVNWDPSFPIDLDRITEPDREFWFKYEGTPKAYIDYDQTVELWGTNLGSLTMIKLNTSSNNTHNLDTIKVGLGEYLDDSFGYSDAGLMIEHVKSDSLATAHGMNIFPMMFLAFSSTIVLAGIALIVTIFLILAESRKYEFGLVRAIGMARNRVVKLYVIEGLIYTLIAGIVGIIFGLLLGWGLVNALNSIWSSAVQGFTIPFYFKPSSLAFGFFTGFIISSLTIFFTARHIANQSILSALYGRPAPVFVHTHKDKGAHTRTRTHSHGLVWLGVVMIVFGCLISAIGIIGLSTDIKLELYHNGSEFYMWLLGPILMFFGGGFIAGYFSNKTSTRRAAFTAAGSLAVGYIIAYSIIVFPMVNAPTMELFFFIGLLFVFSIILIVITNLSGITNFFDQLFHYGNRSSPVLKYSLRNTTRKPARTGQIITIFTLVIFLLAALSINIAIQAKSVDAVSYEERGGYDIIGETAVPISIDLENMTQLASNNIHAPTMANVTVTEILLVGPPGGTCSNMNVRFPPRLLGVGHEFVSENAFRFMDTRTGTGTGTNDPDDAWLELEKTAKANHGRIPIVVDYNTLIWIYEGSLGEIYTIEDESGKEVELEVIGILENSVFGGTFMMSENNLKSLFPTSAEYRYVLFKLKPGVKGSPEEIARGLERELSQYGLDAHSIRELVLENREYERSFMVLFQAFLGLGLVLGIIGMGVVTARTVQERRYEIGVLRALGFTRKMMIKTFIIEHSFIASLAIAIGLIAGILSSYLAFGAWTGGNYEFVLPLAELSILVMVIYLVTFASTLYPALRASFLPPAEALRRVG